MTKLYKELKKAKDTPKGHYTLTPAEIVEIVDFYDKVYEKDEYLDGIERITLDINGIPETVFTLKAVEKLQDKINKAIEYMKKSEKIEIGSMQVVDFYKTLLNILQGEDK